jgi:hypothetical protein
LKFALLFTLQSLKFKIQIQIVYYKSEAFGQRGRLGLIATTSAGTALSRETGLAS